MDEQTKQQFVDTVREKRELMWRIAYALLKNEADAEDAVSSAVEATWKWRHRLRSPEALPAYLVKCTANAAKSQLRKRRFTVPLEPYEAMLQAPEEQDIAHTVSGLPDKFRIPLQLKFGEDMTEKEVARVLGIPRGTVSSRISRALDMLRKEMKEEMGHAGK